MSISTVKNFLEKSGCGLLVAIGMAIAFAIGIIGTSCGRSQGQDTDEPTQQIVVATVGATPISLLEVERSFQARQRQMIAMLGQGGNFETFSPEEEARDLMSTTYELVDEALMAEVGRVLGVKVDEKGVRAMVVEEFDKGLQQQRSSWVIEGKLKADATQAQFEELFKKEMNSDLKLARQRYLDQVDSALKSDEQRPQMMKGALRNAVIQKLEASLRISDEDIRRSKDVLTVKRVFVPNDPGSDAKTTIEKASAEIKAGKPFEEVVATYSKDLPEPGKSLKESVQSLPMTSVLMDPKMEPIKNLKAGEVSGTLELSNGLAIYKLVKVQSNAPKDFAKEKAEYRTPLAQALAYRKLQDEVTSLRKAGKVKWSSKGYELLYEVAATTYDPASAGGPDGPMLKYEDIIKRSQTVIEEDAIGKRAAIFAAYLASNAVWPKLDEGKKKERSDERQTVLEQVLEITESSDVRLELAELLLAKNDPGAVEQTTLAATSNNYYGPVGQRIYSDVATMVLKLQQAKIGDPADIQKIRDEQQRWVQEKKQQDAEMAAERKRQEEERKQAEAEQKAEEARAKAEDAKAKAEDAKNSGGKTSSDTGKLPSSSDITQPSDNPPPSLPSN